MNISNTGYKRNSPDVNNGYNIIPSGKITMQGVDKPLVLIPIVNGKPDYNQKVLANPGDPDLDFGNVDGVLEIPMAQSQYGTIGYTPRNYNSQYEDFLTNPYKRNSYDLNSPELQTIDFNQYNGNYLNSFTDPNKTLQTPNGTFLNKNINTDPIIDSQPLINRVSNRIVGNNNQQLDPNEAQKQSADSQKQEQEQDKGFRGAINPYGGYNLDNTATYLGEAIKDGNALAMVASSLKMATGIGRNIFAGMGKANLLQEGIRNREEEFKKQQEKQNLVIAKKGGELLTGNVITGNPNHPNPNAEVEDGEYLQTPDGQVVEVQGKKHSEGGELIEAPDKTKVVSDYVKIGAPLSKHFKKEYGISVKAGSTFATAIDKYRDKIGLSKLIEEESALMYKLEAQRDIKNQTTKDLNAQLISKKLREIEAKKEPLDKKLSEFTNYVYEHQESKKIQDEEEEALKNGELQYAQEGGELDEQPQEMGGQEDQLEQALMIYAEQNQIPFEELITQIQSLPPEQAEAFIQEIIQSVSSGGQESEQDQIVEQVLTAFAQEQGIPVEQVVKQLQQMQPEEAQAFIEDLISQYSN